MDGLADAAFSLQGLRLEARRRFRCFNSDVEVTLADWTEAWRLSAVEELLRRYESRFSRFLATSELTRLNRRAEPTIAVSPALMAVLLECRWFHQLTDGIFTPLVLDALEAAGYDRSFELLDGLAPAVGVGARAVASFEGVQLDPESGVVSAPLGIRFDLGGIGKGQAVDQAAALLAEADGGFLISAGGDIYAAGRDDRGSPWRVALADARAPAETLTTLRLSDQAVATSWTVRRRWRDRSGWANHLIDPRSGLPTKSDVIGATVVARTTTEADVFAKTSLLLGSAAGQEFIETRQVAALLVLEDGSIVTTREWPGEPVD
jgi:thiamine biosynthesis lipoprotein